MTLSRRHLLTLSTGLFASAFVPALAQTAGRDPRLITIVLRGALDGLAAVPPVGDADFSALRPPAYDGEPLKLDGFFALNPALPNLARLYGAGQAAVIHASATPYRNRSHFDGQDVLESGHEKPGFADSGWMGRLLSTLGTGTRLDGAALKASQGLSVGALTPLVIRGPAPLLGWAPSSLKPADANLAPRLLRLYAENDPVLRQALNDAIETGKIASGMSDMAGGGSSANPGVMRQMAEGSAALMARPDGPRLAAMAFDGWDTHTAEANRLNRLLEGLDGALAAFESGLGAAWSDTVILIITEFGRTAAFNGSKGTDHGQATVALLVGGAVKGGRVLTDWPGLKPAQLYEGRDLKPTTDLRAVIMGVARDHVRADVSQLQTEVFPGALGLKPMDGLIA